VTSTQMEIQLVASVVAAACALPGVFLVLRRMSLMSDAICHAILPGIVVAFLFTEDLSSPLLVVAAAITGLVTVALVEAIHRTRLLKEDAAIGLVFSALFSLGVVLISQYAGGIHLDVDRVLLGELAFAPFNRLEVLGHDIGPKSLHLMGAILLLNILFITLFYKELKLATFDPALAAALGFSPVALHYILMGLVSVTAVGAFDAVGSILVVALMIAPPATAFLLTDRLGRMIVLSIATGVASALLGYWGAHLLDASIAGAMAAAGGFFFGLAFFLAPDRGLLARALRRARRRMEFALRLLAVHLFNHMHLPEASEECRLEHLHEHINWQPHFAQRVVRYGERRQAVRRDDGLLTLTEAGLEIAREALVR